MKKSEWCMILAAILATTNLGMPMPSDKEIARASENLKKKSPYDSAVHYIYFFAQHYMDSDQVETGFVKEAKWWYRELIRTPIHKIASNWPDAFSKVQSLLYRPSKNSK